MADTHKLPHVAKLLNLIQLFLIFHTIVYNDICYIHTANRSKQTILRSAIYGKRFQQARSTVNRPLNVWQKHGQICICLPDSTKDITIFVDVELNPGPTSRKSQSTESSRNATTTRRTYKTRPRLLSSYNLKCIVSNAQSLKSFKKIQDSDGQLKLAQNLHRFQDLVYSEDADIVCVNETWFNHTIDNHEVLHNGYTIYRKDRSEQRAGGVLIALKTEVFKSVREFFSFSICKISR